MNPLAAAAQIFELIDGDVARLEDLEEALLVPAHVLVDQQWEEGVVFEFVRARLLKKRCIGDL